MKLEVFADEKKKTLRVQLIETPDGVLVKRGRVEMKVTGQQAAAVVQSVLLAATEGASLDELCDLFAAPARPSVERLVRELEARGFLASAKDVGNTVCAESNLDVFYWHFGEKTEKVNERLNNGPIVIVGVNYISRELAASLRMAGVEKVEVVDYPFLANLRLLDDDGKLMRAAWPDSLPFPLDYHSWSAGFAPTPNSCLVATSDFGGLELMRQWNTFCVKHGCHFLPIVLQDLIGYVGPLVVPGETACFECLHARQNSHLTDPAVQRTAESSAFQGQAVVGFHPSMASILANIAALELSRFYGRWMAPRIAGTLVEVNMLAMEVAARKVLKVPRCSVCSPLNVHAPVSLDKYVSLPGHPVTP